MKTFLITLMITISLIITISCTPKTDTTPIGSADEMIMEPIESQADLSVEMIETEKHNELLELSEQLAKQLIEGEFSQDLISKLENAGYKRETIDLIKTAMQEESIYKDGVYIGSADAHNGDITIEVTIEKGEIAFIRVLEHSETAPNLPEIFNSLPFNILKNQSTEDVDTISGATEASDGYLGAVEDALEQAEIN